MAKEEQVQGLGLDGDVANFVDDEERIGERRLPRAAGHGQDPQLVSSRYERASVIVTSNKPFCRWGEVVGDATVAAAMIDRLVHHAEIVSLKGDSYRLRDRDLGRVPTDDAA